MLSMTHMIVLFIVVLVVFGPHKLPELARGLGKLMAEFRKASTDFKSAFEQEMRDMERQALQNERRKAAEAAAAAAAAPTAEAAASLPAATETPSQALDGDPAAAEAPVITPVAESVARSSDNGDSAPASTESPAVSSSAHDPTHDQQQPV
jgi:sec-independent protein translocase protein TatB